MKNLRIFQHNTTDGEGIVIHFLKNAVKMCMDAQNEIVFVALEDHKIVIIDKHMELVNQMSIFPEKEDNIPNNIGLLIGFEYLYDDQQLCLIYQTGIVFVLSIKTKKISQMMELKKSILGCSWSPDFQLLIIAAETQLLMVSREFKVLAETLIRPKSPGKDQLLTIGWGSAETQFQGAVGKQNREKQDLNKVPIPIRDEFDDKRVLISWRADAQFFVISSVDEVLIPKQQVDSPSKLPKNVLFDKVLCRQLRVWNRELEFMSQCEFLAGTEAALSTRPQGNLIVVPKVTGKERYIWFYERNGQYRNKFKLDDGTDRGQVAEELATQSVVRLLAWNLDSSILLIYYEHRATRSFQLQFWTVSNYSWTEKLRLEIDELIDAFWDSESAHKFHYLSKAGIYHKIHILSEYNCEDMIAVSVNRAKMRITDFKYAPIPPPMCHYELDLDFVGVPSVFTQSSTYGLAVVGSEYNKISVYKLENRKFVKRHRADYVLEENSHILLNLVWRDENAILAVRKGHHNKMFELIQMNLDNATKKLDDQNFYSISPSVIREFQTLPFAHCIIRYKLNWKSEHSTHLKVEHLKLGDGWLLTVESMKDYMIINGCNLKTVELTDNTLVFLLNSRHQLFVNDKELHSNIFSFSCTNEFLILITVEHIIYCIPIGCVLAFLKNEDKDGIERYLKSGRPVERCAQVIANEPDGTRVWLQLPRGNLEVIHPRPILLERLKKCLDGMEWRKAFVEMRRHRIDLNLIYDHNPKLFIDKIGNFLEQIDDVDSLNVFVSSLSPSDSSRELFSMHYPERQIQSNSKRQETGKVNSICEHIRTHLLNLEDENSVVKFFPVVLYCYIIEKPTRIATALINMREQIAKMNKNANKHGNGNTDLVNRWIRHLTYRINENVLFKQALKTYDMEIALMVAQSTNMDPKEFLPVLNQLKQKALPVAYQKYHIDLFLEDWASALDHIAGLAQQEDDSSPYLEECLKHVQQFDLYSAALKLFCGKPHYGYICGISAKALEKKGRLKEAAILYEKAKDLAAAMHCFLLIEDFFGYIRLARKIDQPKSTIEVELKKMGAQLIHRGNYAVAVEVFSNLGVENYEKILECYEKMNAWKKLTNFAAENCVAIPDIENRARVLLSTRCTQIIEQIDSWKDLISNHSKRLALLRREKKDKIIAMADAKDQHERSMLEDQLDAFSESSISSAASSSISSQYSRMSSVKNRHERSNTRKIARKKQQIREGSQWEDAALLVALKEIYTRIDAQQDELVELLPALLAMDLFDRGSRLQSEMLSFLDLVSTEHRAIWPSQLDPWQLPGPIAELYRESDGNNVRIPSNREAMMPCQIHLVDELCPPKLRFSGAEWKLDIIQ